MEKRIHRNLQKTLVKLIYSLYFSTYLVLSFDIAELNKLKKVEKSVKSWEQS